MDSSVFWWISALSLMSGIICTRMAKSRGRRSITWFILGVLFAPLTILVLAEMGKTQAQIEKDGLQDGTLIECPHCKGVVQKTARACSHCSFEIHAPGRIPDDA